jgi:hypothetical protein
MPSDDLPPNVLDLPLIVRVKMAADRAAARAIEDHRRAGVPLVYWRDGKVVLVPAEELLTSATSEGGDSGPGAANDRAGQ